MRIYSDRFYLLRKHPGHSGFQRWNEWEYYITTGRKARNDRSLVVREYKQTGEGVFRIEDGHLPDYQQRKSETDALTWLQENPWQRITEV